MAKCIKDLIIRQCLEMYTTLRLMSMKWHFSSNATLGMTTVTDRASAWFGMKPVPRMIQNQLGHLLELHMIKLDKELTRGIQAVLEKRERRRWIVGTLSMFFLLHIREIDAGRNIFWKRYLDSV